MLSEEDLRKIVRLAYLTVSDEELKKLTKDFNSILTYVQQLEKIDVTDVIPMSHVHGITNVFRKDLVSESLSTAEALSNAPDTSGSFIRVPIVIE